MNKALLKLIRPDLTVAEIRRICKQKTSELGFDIEKAIFPFNPLLDVRVPKISIGEAVALVKEWQTFRSVMPDSVCVWREIRGSIRESPWCSHRDAVWGSVRDEVEKNIPIKYRESAWDSLWAYISSIFYGIEVWGDIEHRIGANPFSPLIKLWESGYIFTYQDGRCRLHAGRYGAIAWEGEIK